MHGSFGTPPFSFLYQCSSRFPCTGLAIHRYWSWTSASGHSHYPRIFFPPCTRREGGIGTLILLALCNSSSLYASANLVSIHHHLMVTDYWLTKKCRPHIRPQILVCRGTSRLARSLPTRIWPVCGCGLSQRQYFDQRVDEPHKCAP
jgi:hypothetical protein